MKDNKRNKRSIAKDREEKEYGRKSKPRSKRKLDSEVTESSDTNATVSRSGHNDLAWYTKNLALLNNAANISYANPVGQQLSRGTSLAPTFQQSFPGIAVYNLVPGPGIATGGTDPVNIAAKNIYSYIRQTNSGGKNYDPNDLMSYLLAVDEAYMLYFDAARILGVINLYNNENRYAPRTIVRALGWDYDDILSNLANFKYYINAFANKLNALPVPKLWPFYQRHAWMYGGIYADGTSSKAQLYAFAPVIARYRDDATGRLVAFTLTETSSDVVGARVTSPASARTVKSFKIATDKVFEHLINSQDVGTMGGDIKKAFGEGGLITASMVPDNYVIVPTYDEEVLSQFQNATITDGIYNVDITMDNSIDGGNVIYTPMISVKPKSLADYNGSSIGAVCSILPYQYDTIVNLNLNDPKPGDTIVATRLQCVAKRDKYKKLDATTNAWVGVESSEKITQADAYALDIEFCGTEVVSAMKIWYFASNKDGNWIAQSRDIAGCQMVLQQSLSSFLSNMDMLSKFKFHPIGHYAVYSQANNADVKFVEGGAMIEIDNYAIIQHETLGNMHSVCLLSMFDVPIQG